MKHIGDGLSFFSIFAIWFATYCIIGAPEAMAATEAHMMSKGDVAIYLAMFGGVCVGLIALIIRNRPKDDDQFNEPWGM